MEKAKKVLMITSLSTLAVACVMLILAVFGVQIFQGVPLRLLLIFATISVSSGIAISELGVINRKKTLGLVGISLLGLSVVLALIVFCTNLLVTESVFNRITGIVSVCSITFIVIISIYSKLGKSLLAMQIPTYTAFGLFATMACVLIGGVDLFSIKGMLEIFIVLAIVCAGLLIASAVIGAKKKSSQNEVNSKTKMVSITLDEYQALKAEAQSLKAENEALKSQLEKQVK